MKPISFLMMFMVMIFTIPISSMEDKNDVLPDDPVEVVMDYQVDIQHSVDAVSVYKLQQFNHYLDFDQSAITVTLHKESVPPDLYISKIQHYIYNMPKTLHNNIEQPPLRTNVIYLPNIGLI